MVYLGCNKSYGHKYITQCCVYIRYLHIILYYSIILQCRQIVDGIMCNQVYHNTMDKHSPTSVIHAMYIYIIYIYIIYMIAYMVLTWIHNYVFSSILTLCRVRVRVSIISNFSLPRYIKVGYPSTCTRLNYCIIEYQQLGLRR